MGSKDPSASEKAGTATVEQQNKRREIINWIVLLFLFTGYTLTFMIPKFYGATDAYVGVFVFLMCVCLFLNNVDLIRMIKSRDKETFLLAGIILLAGINLLIVNSGKGAFFVVSNFVLIWYLSDKILLTKRQITVLSGLYLLLLLYWLLAAYPNLFSDYESYAYNTNTAATFTVFTLLCAFVFLQQLYEKHEIVGLFMVILLLKGVQLVLWHRARGAFIMLVMFVFFNYIAPKKWRGNKKLFGFLCLLATLGSLVFVCVYVLIGTTGVNFQIPFFYKPVFSGRNRIWYEFWTLFIQKPLTGIGTNVTLESFWEFNVHNAMYNILVVHGIVVFAGVLYFVYKRLNAFREIVCNNRLALCALSAVIAVFFESYFDVDLIWADYALNLIFLLAVVNHPTGIKKVEETNGKV